MRFKLQTGTQACLLLLMHAVQRVAGLNFTQCLIDIVTNANATQDLAGLLDGNGNPVSNVSDATAISYSLCTSVCGTGREPFQWPVFSQDFSTWLLPNLALISQLPFGAQYRLDNLMSAVLTVGSPVLADFAVSILSSLQQVPLRLHPSRFPFLIVLPENGCWWKWFSEFVNYTHTWSIASATSVAWVVVAYIMNVINSPADVYTSSHSDGDATGSLWLWLIPIVVGWLQLSPKCDFRRLQAAYSHADQHAHIGPAGAHMGTLSASARRALTITAREKDVMSPDELLTPPVFNYSRSLRWASTADTVFSIDWVESDTSGTIHPSNRCGSSTDIIAYLHRSHWAPGVFTRMAIASCASLVLQWGTCVFPTYVIIWMLLLMSSILAHYSAGYSHRKVPSARIASVLSHWLRWAGKALAVANSIWLVLACAFVYSSFYNTCFCNSSVVSRGEAAYNVIIETAAQAAQLRVAWIGGLIVACTSSFFFLGLMNLLLDTVLS
ncbi:hypothetical protein BDR06DRAFT_989810 [Suillus hirtellus]|nr:hypothetical protein BDR06DRAFT_989810 [Suillus hirtellus]